jgi:hypothetical protein
MSAKKGGRRKKSPVTHASVSPLDPDFNAARQLAFLAIDPKGSDSLSLIFEQVISGKPSKTSLTYAGLRTACMIRDAPADVLEEFFRRIILLKRESEKTDGEKDRNWHVLKGFIDFEEEAGRKPRSKSELKAFLLARKETYKNLPDEGDGTGWTRAFKAGCLDGLPKSSKKPGV